MNTSVKKQQKGYTPIGELRQNFSDQATKILARTFFRELKQHGYTPKEIIALATELIELVGSDLDSEEGPDNI